MRNRWFESKKKLTVPSGRIRGKGIKNRCYYEIRSFRGLYSNESILKGSTFKLKHQAFCLKGMEIYSGWGGRSEGFYLGRSPKWHNNQ